MLKKTKLKFFMMFVLIVGLVVVLEGSVRAQVLFQDNFDNPTPSDWDCSDGVYDSWTSISGADGSPCTNGLDCNGVNTISSSIEATGHGGLGKSYRINRCNGYDTGYTGSLSYDPTSSVYPIRRVYHRFYMKIPTGWDYNSETGETKLSRYYIRNTNEGVSVSAPHDQIRVSWYGTTSNAYLRTLSYLGDFFTGETGGVWRTFPGNVNLREYDDDAWHCWEFMLDIQTSQVVVELWIDGVSQGQTIEAAVWGSGSYPNLTIRALGGFGWGNMNGGFNFPTDEVYSIEYDDFVVGTEYIGPINLSTNDTTSPTRFNPAPSGIFPSGTTSTNISLSTNMQAVCRYSNNSGTNYTDMTGTFTSTNSTNHSTEVSGLENGQTYIFYVRCNSSDGIMNDDDWNITFSIDGHKADLNDDGVINMPELIACIARWKTDDGVTKAEVEEARDIWFTGGIYFG